MHGILIVYTVAYIVVIEPRVLFSPWELAVYQQ